MNRLLVCLALLIAAVPVGVVAAAKVDTAAFQGKRVSIHVRAPAAFRENEDDKIKFGAGDRPFGQVLAKDGAPIPPLQDPAPVVGSGLAASLATAFGAVPAQGPKPDYELHLLTYSWGFSPHARQPGRYYLHQGVELKLVRSSDRLVLVERRCHPDTRRHANAPTLERLSADQARLVRAASKHLAWVCVRELAQEAFGVGAEQVAPTPPEFVDPFATRGDGQSRAKARGDA